MGVDITRSGGVVDNIAVSGNTLVNVGQPSRYTLSAGATVGSNVRWTGNVGPGVVNTANSPADPGAKFVSNYYGPASGALSTAAPPLNTLHAYPLPVSAAGG